MKKTFMRTVGVLSTAAMLAVGAMSITASADGAAKLSMDQIYAEPGQEVSFAMSVENLGTSWTGLEFLVNYDARLEATLNKAGTAASISYGNAIDPDLAGEISRGGAVSKELTADGQKGFAFALGTATAISGDGQLCIFKFTVPTDAQPGDEFPVNLTINEGSFIDANKENIPFETVNGWIKIKEETVTSETTTTTTTTTEGAAETSAPVVTTSAVTTTKTPDVKPPKMGVDGVALGVVGMLSAAAAAAVVLKKKKD